MALKLLETDISRPGSYPTDDPNTPGSGLGDGNLLCGVGVVYLYPYSLKSSPFSRIAFLAAVSNSCRFMGFQFYQKVYAEQVQLPIL